MNCCENKDCEYWDNDWNFNCREFSIINREKCSRFKGQEKPEIEKTTDNFKTVGKYWTIYLKSNKIMKDNEVEIQPGEVSEMMELFKFAGGKI